MASDFQGLCHGTLRQRRLAFVALCAGGQKQGGEREAPLLVKAALRIP